LGLWVGAPTPKPPNPNPQSPIPNPQKFYVKNDNLKMNNNN